jgi:tRNA threonylcarbamoyladenosine biosynthesis protein TsaE
MSDVQRVPTPSSSASSTRHRTLANEAATAALAIALASHAEIGDVIGLSGPLGAGKTSFARAFIQTLAGPLEVPSPTFTLVQTYETESGSIWHFDLYRLAAPDDAFELGIEDAFAEAISLIEWPERLAHLMPPDWLLIRLNPGAEPATREVVLSAFGPRAERLLAGLA